jgi:hypothetical protein
MTVNALMTGMIVFKILKVFMESKPTSIERTLGSSTGGGKLRHVLFIIIESGMALFAIQLARVVLTSLMQLSQSAFTESTGAAVAIEYVICIHQMLNVIIIRPVYFYYFFFLFFTDDIFYLAIIRASRQQ